MAQKSKILLLLFFLVLTIKVLAADESGVFVQGIVVDDSTDEPLPYASVLVNDTGNRGTVADDHGLFAITVPLSAKSLQVSCVGYEKTTVELRRTSHNLYQVRLRPARAELQELVVHKQKYSKKNNPAVAFMERLKSDSRSADPERHPYYSYDRYERISMGLNDFNVADTAAFNRRKYGFLSQYIDTSDMSGKTVLTLALNEKASHIDYRRDPQTRRETVSGYRSTGIDEIADKASMQVFYEDVLREVDIFQNDINLLQNRFVSPLGRLAPDFYKFYLTDTVSVGNDRCVVLAFYPHNKSSFGFTGQVYVPLADTLSTDSVLRVRRVEMRVPSGINLNFVENLYIAQDFATAPNGTRLKTSDVLAIEAAIIPGTQGLYATRTVCYDNHSFEPPADLSVFDSLAPTIEQPGSGDRTEEFWAEARQVGMSRGEQALPGLMERIRSVKFFYWTEQVLKVLVNGYIPTSKNSKFDFGPVNTTVSFGDVEGLRLRLGGMTTANLSPHIFARGYVAYGTKDRKFKYKAELEYSFNRKEYHSREFPIHALRGTYQYDVDQLGQHYLFTNQDNVFISLKRMPDWRVTYRRLARLEYILELANNFSLTASASHVRQEATQWVPFCDGAGRSFGHYNEMLFSLQLRYAPGEKFYQNKTHRVPINLDAPVFVLEHTFAPRGFAGSMFEVNKTELNISKRIWLSAFGYVDAMVGAGHVWSASSFPDLLLPNANLSYIIEPQSYALMNAMEFVNSSYASWDVTYWLNGALFNLIPGVKKLKLREVASVRGLWGHLSRRCNPEYNPELFAFPEGVSSRGMTNVPYVEAAVGLDNILSCLRVDYVWRLTYRHPPYAVDRSGLRVSFHVTF